MKNLISKIRSLSLALMAAFFVAVPLVQAADSGARFNDLPQDNEFLVGRKAGTTNSWTDPVNGITGGDDVEVAVYYHNARVDTVAKNTKIKITLPDSSFRTQHVITGELSADDTPSVTGTVVNGQETGNAGLTINTDPQTKISFVPGSVRWYPNRMDTSGTPANLPFGQNGDSIVTTGINLGDIQGCFQYAGYVIFKVHFEGQTIVKLPKLTVEKDVRKAGTNDPYINEIQANPGQEVDYRIVVRNIDGAATAKNVRVIDVLENGITAVFGSVQLIKQDGTVIALPGDFLNNGGAVVLPELGPLEHFTLYFRGRSSAELKNDDCVINRVKVTADSISPTEEDTAKVCFVVKVVPTPTPQPPKETPAPQPVLPKTGPEAAALALAGFGTIGGSVSRYYLLKGKLKKKLSDIDII